jgi:hypothetical protein
LYWQYLLLSQILQNIEEYNGSIGPDNALYGLKLAFENIDESFTWNASEKLGKKVEHSRLRISEAKAELRKQNNQAAEKAFEHYREKIRETEESISDMSGTESGISNAQIMIEKHQYVLEQLIESHPNNTGLQNAYNRSQELKYKFEQKTDRKIERIRTSEGKHILREINVQQEVKKEDRNNKDNKDNKENIREDKENGKVEITQEKRENRTQIKEERTKERTENRKENR